MLIKFAVRDVFSPNSERSYDCNARHPAYNHACSPCHLESFNASDHDHHALYEAFSNQSLSTGAIGLANLLLEDSSIFLDEFFIMVSWIRLNEIRNPISLFERYPPFWRIGICNVTIASGARTKPMSYLVILCQTLERW